MSRAIDADYLLRRIWNMHFMDSDDKHDVINFIQNAPTVISDSAFAIADPIKEAPDEGVSIIFRPICSHCGRRIVNTEIDYVPDDSMIGDTKWIHFSGHVEPRRCPYCKSFFERIEIPTRLPYTDKITKGSEIDS